MPNHEDPPQTTDLPQAPDPPQVDRTRQAQSAPEEFWPDDTSGNTGDTPAGTAAARRRSFASRFPTSDEMGTTSPRSTGPNLWEDSPFDEETTDLYVPDPSAKIEEFKVLECTLPMAGVPPEPCPICYPNPYAYVPDYRMMEDGEVFFDGKECTQNIVYCFEAPAIPVGEMGITAAITTTATVTQAATVGHPGAFAHAGITAYVPTGPTVSELNSKKFQDEHKERAIRLLLDYYNKSDIATVFTYELQPPKVDPMGLTTYTTSGIYTAGPVGSVVGAEAAVAEPPQVKKGYEIRNEEIDMVAELMQYAKFDFSIPIQLKARTRVLISVPVEQLNRVPPKLVSEPVAEFQTSLEVAFEGREFVTMMHRPIKAFKVYNHSLKQWHTFEGGKLIETKNGKTTTLNLDDEAAYLKSFLNGMIEFIEDLGFSFNPLKPAKIPEKLVFKFEEKGEDNIKLRQIIVNLPGCPLIKIAKNGRYKGIFNDLAKKSPFNRTRTLSYIGALPEIDIALTARTPTPWLEVVTKYTFPPLEVFYGSNTNTSLNDPTMFACLAKQAIGEGSDESFDELMDDVTGMVLDIPDQILAKFGKLSCYSREQLEEHLKDLSGDFKDRFIDQRRRISDEMKKSLAQDEPYLAIVMEELFPAQTAFGELTPKEQDTEIKKWGSRKQYIDKHKMPRFWRRLNHELGYCGWIGLILAAIDCVAQGLGEESTIKALTKAAFGSMDDAYLGRTFLGLSPEAQQKVADSMKRNFGSMPAPWETEKFGGTYQPGSYSGPGFVKGEEGSGKVDPEDYTGAGTFGMDYSEGEFDFNDGKGSQGSGGTLGGAIGGLQKEAADALRSSMLDAVGADVLLEQMERIPGAPIVTKMLKHLPCKQTPLIFCEPRLDSFLNTIEFDFCNWDKGITYPAFGENFEGLPNLIKMIMAAIKEVLIETAVAILMAAIKFLLEKLFSLACDLLATLGASLLDVFAGSDHFKNLLKDNMCPDASTEELNDALIGLFSAIGGPEATCLEKLSNSEMGEFIDDLSLMLTQGQILQLLSGNPTEETIRLAIEVAQTSNSECIREIFSDPNAFQTFFPSLGIFIPNLSDLRDNLSPNVLDSPISPCPPDTVGKIEDLKCQLLAQKGLSKKECREQIDDLKDKAIQDLEDLANMLQDPFAGMPPLESAGGDPCNPEGLLAPTDPYVSDFNAGVTKALFESIESAHLKDLWSPISAITGHGGVLNGIMSDTKGRPYKKHQWLVGTFGTPLAKDLGPFQWYSDDALRPDADAPGKKSVPINIFGDQLKDEEGSVVNLLGYSEGGYPPTVGAYMAKQYREMTPEFKTINVPGGYKTMEKAIKELQRIEKLNKKVVRLRLKYIEAFILEFGLESKKTWAMKFAAAASDLRQGATLELFGKDPTKDTLKHKVHSPGNRAWRVLNGKNISIAGQLIGTQPPKGWDYRKRSGVDKDAKSFIEFAERMQGTKNAIPINLWDLPDTSSADMRLFYESYPDDPTQEGEEGDYLFSLEYDYNLFDTETGTLSEENKYKLKIVETHRSPKGKNLKKHELKKMGDTLPPVSILQEDEYTYTSHDLTIDSAPPGDVKNIIDTLNIGAPPDFEDSYEIQTFYKFIAKKLIDASDAPNAAFKYTTGIPKFRNYFAKKNRPGPGQGKITLYDEISAGFLERISTIIATGNPNAKPMKGRKGDDADEQTGTEERISGEIALDDISRGFLFGYDPYKEPKIIDLDPAVYGGPLGRLFPEAVPPPFYVQERKHKGWMDICDTLVPEVSGCEQESKAVYNLGDLKDMVGELGEALNPDPRLVQDPLCSQESPYDRIMSSFDAANIDGAIRAIVRIYTLDVFIRGIPVFVSFGLSRENYDDLLLAFVSDRIKTGLYSDRAARTGKTDDEYYYRVLEQAFNNTVRKIDSGLLHRLPTSIEGEPAELDPEKEYLTEAEDAALERIRKVVRRFYRENDGELPALSDTAIKSQTMFRRAFSTRGHAALTGIGAGSARFSKYEAMAAKMTAFEETIRETEDDAVIFLRRYVREEFEKLREDFSIRMPAVVDNIDHLFLLNGEWIRGAVAAGGPTDVTSNPLDSEAYNIKTIEAPTEEEGATPGSKREEEEEKKEKIRAAAAGVAVAAAVGTGGIGLAAGAIVGAAIAGLNDDEGTTEEADSPPSPGYWPFVLEKYIRIEEKNNPPVEISDRASNLYNTVNLKDWNKYVKEKKAQGLVGDISDFWGNPPPEGETTEIESHIHTYKIDEDGNGMTGEYTNEVGEIHFHEIIDGEIQRANMDPEDDGHTHDIEITGWKFGLRLSYMPSKKDNSVFASAIGTIGDETIMSEKAYKLTDRQGDDRYLIPLAFAELPIPDQDFTLYDPKKYDVYCLIQELVKTPEYKTMFKYVFPLPRFTSFLALYCVMGFLASIGNVGFPGDGGDMWETAGGKKLRKFRKWVRGPNAFKKSRKAARSVFNSLYDSTQDMDFSAEDKHGHNAANSLRDLIRPRVNFEDGLRWWQRGRRIHNNPYNIDGDEC
tara:strand:+ start:572 stop:8077 length:7506 start_codon:yes stop_codon:yes gene_type:complete